MFCPLSCRFRIFLITFGRVSSLVDEGTRFLLIEKKESRSGHARQYNKHVVNRQMKIKRK